MHFTQLKVWQKANDLAMELYRTTALFPREEMYALTTQIRRAALSVPSNIVEGYARKGLKELKYFLNIAIGSLAEVEFLLGFSRDMNFLKESEYIRLKQIQEEVGRLLWGFYQKARK